MGYGIDLAGQWTITPPLQARHRAYLVAFHQTRRMQRDACAAVLLPDPIREHVGLPIGAEGAYFVGGGGLRGQDRDASVVEANQPPQRQPRLWCGWVPNEEGSALRWDGDEQFSGAVSWIEYLIARFLAPWGYTLNGTMRWEGDEPEDRWAIVIIDNRVQVQAG